MSDRPTPRTDAVNCEDGLPIESRYDKMHDLAEDLERELAEALETLSMAINSANARQAETEHARRRLAEARDEGEEQARLLGMSGEREAGLLAEIDSLKRELAETLREHQGVYDVANQLNARLRDLIIERNNAETDRRQAASATIQTLHERNKAQSLLAAANKGAERNAEALRILSEKLNEARGQRDEAKEALQSADRHNQHMLVELEVAREQRDRLAEALEDAKAALAALEGGAR